MKSLTEMLESEIVASEQFTRQSFGLKVGDGFPELVKEVANSEKVVLRLLMGIMTAALRGHEAAKTFAIAKKADGKPDYYSAVLSHADTYEIPLAMLYWGIEVGRKLEREEAQRTAESDKL
jgi:hypothetical protein